MAIKYKVIFCILFCLTTSFTLFAQSSSNTAKDIAKIKRDSLYIYAETTMKETDEAIEGAKAILETMVTEWVRQKYPDENIEVCIVKAKEHCQQMQTRRGDFYRAFVYVKKTDIMPVSDKREVAVFKMQSADNQYSTVSTENAIEENTVGRPLSSIKLTDEERRMINIHRFHEIEPYVKGLKNSGMLNGYGKYATMPSGEFCHLFVYNREGDVVALIKNTPNGQVNLNTLQQDDIKKYKNCGAIWLQLKTNNL